MDSDGTTHKVRIGQPEMDEMLQRFLADFDAIEMVKMPSNSGCSEGLLPSGEISFRIGICLN